jgi:SAM-dependent methyltransferase
MSFGTIAADYDRLRSGPAGEALGWLLPDPCEKVLDLAAGTGLLSRAIASRVPRAPRVIAVEPDGRMAGFLASRSPGVSVVRGVGEALPVADASVDAVLISSAWHWLNPARAVPELTRVLRDGGRLGLLWTGPDREAGWLRSLSRPFRPSRQRERPRLEMPGGAAFGNVTTDAFIFSRPMTTDDFVDMLATYSALITATPAERDAELAHARGEIARLFPHGGPLAVPMRTRCWRADRLPR